MSKGKIIAAFQEPAEQLKEALPREQQEQLKKMERAFTEMRHLHSMCEQRWHEADELSKKQAGRLAAYEMFTKEQETNLHRCEQAIDRLTKLLQERVGLVQLNRQSEQRQREFQVKVFDFSSQCKMTEKQWVAFITDFNRQAQEFYGGQDEALKEELWSSPRKVDTELRVFPFVLGWGYVPQRRVSALAVVEDFDVFGDRRASFGPRGEVGIVD